MIAEQQQIAASTKDQMRLLARQLAEETEADEQWLGTELGFTTKKHAYVVSIRRNDVHTHKEEKHERPD